MKKMYDDEPENAVSIMRKKLIEALKAHPNISYKDAKKMAESANIAIEIFEDAWDELHYRRKTILQKILPTLVIIATIFFSIRVGSENREALYDLFYDVQQDTKQDILKLLPTDMPYWAKELGLQHPESLALKKDQTIITSVQNNREGYYSLKFVYKGRPEIVSEQAEKMAEEAEIGVAMVNDTPLVGENFAQYGSAEERFGENKEFSIIILASDDELTLKVTNERQLEAKRKITERQAEELAQKQPEKSEIVTQ